MAQEAEMTREELEVGLPEDNDMNYWTRGTGSRRLRSLLLLSDLQCAKTFSFRNRSQLNFGS